MYKKIIFSEFNSASKILKNFLEDKKQIENIQKAAILIAQSFKNEKKVISCGNGGSHCDAVHFSEELTSVYRKKRSGYPAISISDSSYISAVGNDFGYDQIFSRFIQSVGHLGDILLAISTSGNSLNIVRAIEEAKKKKMKVIVLTGNNAGKIKNLSDIEICIPHCGYSDRIQEMHIKIIHILILIIEKEMQKN
ncbi:D-sedoheptulose 7-phosphate isomerase [Buchnera aphidicola str. APS (Acyrthosiphon pisum)]|uniref:Phosphoheptose isomerase n=3 Tax=Buchnera aphidicola TaxID=9 RepID=GMHA_BUCAI|nr:D-sedoheptulose 7-phosphate isomerase [Buchnera aphidicola]B8D7E7.1 RecName: Full=Phosphoheptose isomerase; AltName: Full=Sedoheptulose 7-phosphate isomerase [Buchnera aphidicola str. Tuc7 (Acyrthosiphon pisum)]B8D943.1 RecName: Full=Phosphoheptose isomerase; AltName: Full=Sedoheptulose 7-phosphate isomerase [Buchnera aphidicola str. 5A (Acyrthosiphon pisum)]P57338.1 RecName: Full=Phosphoheptose isomerase; AltName: Full=Sedoheptulose 7-phosphate isomerase [Buchnera aphidicola str. APS (Acyrth